MSKKLSIGNEFSDFQIKVWQTIEKLNPGLDGYVVYHNSKISTIDLYYEGKKPAEVAKMIIEELKITEIKTGEKYQIGGGTIFEILKIDTYQDGTPRAVSKMQGGSTEYNDTVAGAIQFLNEEGAKKVN